MSGSFEDLRTASVNGASLAYREEGKGEPVLFVHGSGGDLRTWAGQMPAVGEDYRAIAYSRRFARPNADIDPHIDDQMLPHVDDLVAFLRDIEVPTTHLVGHSWGGFIALLVAIQHPEVVRSLVLMEPPVLPLLVSTPPRPSEILRLFLARPATAVAIVKFGATAFGPAQQAFRRGDNEAGLRAFARGVLGKANFAHQSEATIEQLRDNVSAVRAQLLGAGFPSLDDNAVRGVRAPVLLVVGAQSPAFFRRLSDRLQELLRDATRTEIAEASHLMHVDNAPAFNGALLGFLKSHASEEIIQALRNSAPG